MQDLPRNFHSFEYGSGKAPSRAVLFPGYTLLPFIRDPLGFDIVNPKTAIMRTLLLLLAGYLGQFVMPHAPPEDFALLACFALAYLALSLVRFFRRWRGQGRGEDIHTAEAGYSFLARMLPLPVAITEILILPALIALMGSELWDSGNCELGGWLMLAALSLSLMGWWEYRRRWSQHRALTDDVLRAESYSERMQARESRARSAGRGRRNA
jgi:hypothetical protein